MKFLNEKYTKFWCSHFLEKLSLCLHSFSRAMITEYHKLDNLKTTNLLSHGSRGWKSECKVLVRPCSLQSLWGRSFLSSSYFWWPQMFPGLWQCNSNLCLCFHMAICSLCVFVSSHDFLFSLILYLCPHFPLIRTPVIVN